MTKYNPISNSSMPFLMIDDYYSPETLEGVWKEIDFYSHTEFQTSDENPPAIKDGKKRGDFKRIPMDHIYTHQGGFKSLIFGGAGMMSHDDFGEAVKETFKNVPGDFFHWFKVTNFSNTIVTYYEHGHFYKPHIDVSHFTLLIWLYKEPKNFTGGDFGLYHKDDYENPVEKIELKNNRAVLFPSYYTHGVDKISAIDNNRNDKWGRYCVSHFVGRNEQHD